MSSKMSVESFNIHVPDHKIDRLQQKFALSDFPSDISTTSEISWEQGVPVAEVKRLVAVWQNSYDWRKVEAQLNALPQFLAPIEVEGHGSSIYTTSTRGALAQMQSRFYSSMGGRVAFSSLPRCRAQSGGLRFLVRKWQGFLIEHHAEACDKLMQKLGYNQYVTQGGDVGSLIARHIAKAYGPSRCRAHHTNTASPAQPTAETHPDLHAEAQSTPPTEDEQKALGRLARFMQDGFGYYKQQSTKPQTTAFVLRDSPVALLAWLYEKMHDWSDDYPWTDEEILTWVSVYYFSTAGPEASSKVYHAMEHASPTAFVSAQAFVDVPLGISRFANDLVLLPRLWNRSLGPIVFEGEHARGGHFAAWENPDAIVGDLRKMFGGSIRYVNA